MFPIIWEIVQGRVCQIIQNMFKFVQQVSKVVTNRPENKGNNFSLCFVIIPIVVDEILLWGKCGGHLHIL